MRRAALSTILCLLLAAPQLACIGVQSNDARSFQTFPPAAIAGETRFGIAVTAYVQPRGAAAASSLRGGTTGVVRNAYAHYLERTGRAKVNETGPFRVQIVVEDRGAGPGAVFAGFLTVFTLYVVPSWASHDYRTTVSVVDAAGRLVGQTQYRHRLTVVQQLFLAAAMPFAGIQSSYDAMWNEVMRDAAAWTIEVLDAHAETDPGQG